MTDITVTLTTVQPDAEERRARCMRAKEVLSGAGWLFDEHISVLTRDLLATAPSDSGKRETLYHQIDAAAQLKGRLHQIIQIQEAEDKVANERKQRAGIPTAD